MPNNSDNFQLLLQRFIALNEDRYDSFGDLMNDFNHHHALGTLDMYLERGEKDVFLAMDLLEESEYEDDEEKKLQLILQAERLDPKNIDIIKRKIELQASNIFEMLTQLEKIEQDFRLEFYDRLIVSGYLDVDNRPYFRLKKDLILHYIENKLYLRAINHCKDMLTFNKNDNLGVRYTLMAAYINSHQYDKVVSFYKKDEAHQDDDTLVFYTMTAQILAGQLEAAEDLLHLLYEMNPAFLDLFESEPDPMYVLSQSMSPYYEPNSSQSIAIALDPIIDFYVESDYYYNFIYAFASKEREKAVLNRKEQQALYDLSIFQGLTIQRIHILCEAGLDHEGAFQQVTEDQVLNLRGIGPATIKILKENGVRFSSQE